MQDSTLLKTVFTGSSSGTWDTTKPVHATDKGAFQSPLVHSAVTFPSGPTAVHTRSSREGSRRARSPSHRRTHALAGAWETERAKFWKEVRIRSKNESGRTCRESVGRLVPGLAEARRPSRPRGTRGGRCLCGSCARAPVFVLSAPHMV